MLTWLVLQGSRVCKFGPAFIKLYSFGIINPISQSWKSRLKINHQQEAPMEPENPI
jgi:hypothetical protein